MSFVPIESKIQAGAIRYVRAVAGPAVVVEARADGGEERVADPDWSWIKSPARSAVLAGRGWRTGHRRSWTVFGLALLPREVRAEGQGLVGG